MAGSPLVLLYNLCLRSPRDCGHYDWWVYVVNIFFLILSWNLPLYGLSIGSDFAPWRHPNSVHYVFYIVLHLHMCRGRFIQLLCLWYDFQKFYTQLLLYFCLFFSNCYSTFFLLEFICLNYRLEESFLLLFFCWLFCLHSLQKSLK